MKSVSMAKNGAQTEKARSMYNSSIMAHINKRSSANSAS